jgi:hypothetical protein
MIGARCAAGRWHFLVRKRLGFDWRKLIAAVDWKRDRTAALHRTRDSERRALPARTA